MCVGGAPWLRGGTAGPGRDTLFYREKLGELGRTPGLLRGTDTSLMPRVQRSWTTPAGVSRWASRGGTGHWDRTSCFTEKIQGNRPSPRPSPALLSSPKFSGLGKGEELGRDTATGRDWD